MTATDRLASERLFHDRQAAERADSFRRGRADLRFADADFFDHETWVRPAVAALGDLRDRDVLDYGCGHGMAAVTFARAGGRVTAFDLSPGYAAEAAARAEANGVSVRCLIADAEDLPFPDRSFDAVWGNAVLHHLDLSRAARELDRVLRPSGVAVFCEPWGGNPLLRLARRRLPYPGKGHTPDERPLRHGDLAPLRAVFPRLTVRGYQLLGMAGRLLGRRPVPLLDRVDRGLLAAVPPLENWCRYVVLTLPKG
jgi:SAM-dependent methyltransferase